MFALMTPGERARPPRLARLQALALAVLASLTLSVPSAAPIRRGVRGLLSAAEIRALGGEVPGLTLRLDVVEKGPTQVVRATLRNRGTEALLVAWPDACHAGRRVYGDGDVVLVLRSLR